MLDINEIIQWVNQQTASLADTCNTKMKFFLSRDYQRTSSVASTKFETSLGKQKIESRQNPGEESTVEQGLRKTILLKSHIKAFSVSYHEEYILSILDTKIQQCEKDKGLSNEVASILTQVLLEYVKAFKIIEIKNYPELILKPILNILDARGQLESLTAQDLSNLLLGQSTKDIKSIFDYKTITPQIKDNALHQLICLEAKTIKITKLRELVRLLSEGGIEKMFKDAPDELVSKFLNNLYSNEEISAQNKKSVVIDHMQKIITKEKLAELSPMWLSFTFKGSSERLEEEEIVADSKFAKVSEDEIESMIYSTEDEGDRSVTISPPNYSPITLEEIMGECSSGE